MMLAKLISSSEKDPVTFLEARSKAKNFVISHLRPHIQPHFNENIFV